ncbi:MAG: antibiotic biosynthesis monooxygenase [Planctomycetes bacterium]|nr:antibiotic biosynthesis monooxygenase [Planctomycetota bacterium]
MDSSLYIMAKIGVAKQYRDEFLELAKGLVAASSSEAGNDFYILTESADDPEVFCFIEHWKSQQAIDEHNATPHFGKFQELVKKYSFPVSMEITKPVL